MAVAAEGERRPRVAEQPAELEGVEHLGVARTRGTVRVEPFVTVGYATRFLLARGHMLAVTLEIEDATLGGLAMAVGMTTHSHKVGLLFETVVAYEVIIADGTLAGVEALATCLQTRLGPERSWAAEADRVRAAVRAALEAQAPGCASGPCGSCPRSA